ncbi:MAG: hypothetical protein V1750_02575 [Acidobacteriota bacterium]
MRGSRLVLAAFLGGLLLGGWSAPAARAQGTTAPATRVAPAQFAQGTTGSTMTLFGAEFVPPMTILPVKPPGEGWKAIRFGPVQVLSRTLAITTVTVDKETRPGSYTFYVTRSVNTAAPLPPGQFTLRVIAGSSVLAPAAVTTVAVVHPLEGTLLAEDEQLYPRALLATTGTGTIAGYWELDGVPFERFVVSARAGLPVGVSARSPIPHLGVGGHLLTARVDLPQTVRSEPVRVVLVPPKGALLRLVSPAAGAASAADERGGGPQFRWTPQPGAIAYEVLLSSRPGETPAMRRIRVREAAMTLAPETRAKLVGGPLWWSVRPIFPGEVAGKPAPWRRVDFVAHAADLPEGLGAGAGDVRPAVAHGGADFEVTTAFHQQAADDGDLRLAASEESESDPAATAGGANPDWRIDLDGALVSNQAKDADNQSEARLPATLTVAYEKPEKALAASVDLSFLREIDPGDAGHQEAHSYVVNGRLGSRPWGLLAGAGYFGPAGVADSTLLAVGLVRGGAEVGVQTPAGLLSAYGSYDDSPSGATSQTMSGEQRVRIASWALPVPENVGLLRLMMVDARDDGDLGAGIPAAEARSYGLLGAFQLTPSWRLDLETALSRQDETSSARGEGDAYRLGLVGELAGASVALAFNRTDASFVNPASGSLAPGGIPDRTGGDLTVSRFFGETSTGFAYPYPASHADAGGATPGASQHALDAALDTPLGAALRLAVNASHSRGVSDATAVEPELTVTSSIANAALTGTWGAMSVSQSLAWQSTRNRGSAEAALSDVEVLNATLSVGGALGPAWVLSGNASWTRNEPALGPAAAGTLVSLQPTWRHARSGFSASPVLTATWDDIAGAGQQRTLHGQLTLAWNPPAGVRFPLGLSVSGGWRETTLPALAPEPAHNVRDWTASVSLLWRWGRGSSAAGGSSTAGATSTAALGRAGWPGCPAAGFGSLPPAIGSTPAAGR